MKKLFLFMVFLLIQKSSFSQSLTPFVISSSGNFSSSGTISLSSTVGEMTMVETFRTGANILTQGFQQPNDLSVGINEPEKNFSITWFPNPSGGQVSLLCDLRSPGQLSWRIYDHVGRIVRQHDSFTVQELYSENMNLAELAEGIYRVETLFKEELTDRVSVRINVLSIIH